MGGKRPGKTRLGGLLRRFVKKGKSIGDLPPELIALAAQWNNNLPRKMLGYRTPAEAFAAEPANIESAWRDFCAAAIDILLFGGNHVTIKQKHLVDWEAPKARYRYISGLWHFLRCSAQAGLARNSSNGRGTKRWTLKEYGKFIRALEQSTTKAECICLFVPPATLSAVFAAGR
jgi:hypothetical protein